MQELGMFNFHEDSTTTDIVLFLGEARSDAELKLRVGIVDRAGKRFFGERFMLQFEEAIVSNDFRKRVFLRADVH